jgi:hypothetical protein
MRVALDHRHAFVFDLTFEFADAASELVVLTVVA